jgi:peptidyl-prolyl cis-trans isomerase D
LQLQDLGQATIEAVLGADPKALPAVVGIDLGSGGYVVAKILKVIGRDPVAADPARTRSQYVEAWGDAETQAYYAGLKTRLKVSVDDKAAAEALRAESTESR